MTSTQAQLAEDAPSMTMVVAISTGAICTRGGRARAGHA